MMFGRKDDTMPTPEELQKDLTEFFKKKYGDKGFVGIVPQMQAAGGEEGREEAEEKEPELTFDFRPKDIKSYLERFVVKVDFQRLTHGHPRVGCSGRRRWFASLDDVHIRMDGAVFQGF